MLSTKNFLDVQFDRCGKLTSFPKDISTWINYSTLNNMSTSRRGKMRRRKFIATRRKDVCRKCRKYYAVFHDLPEDSFSRPLAQKLKCSNRADRVQPSNYKNLWATNEQQISDLISWLVFVFLEFSQSSIQRIKMALHAAIKGKLLSVIGDEVSVIRVIEIRVIGIFPFIDWILQFSSRILVLDFCSVESVRSTRIVIPTSWWSTRVSDAVALCELDWILIFSPNFNFQTLQSAKSRIASSASWNATTSTSFSSIRTMPSWFDMSSTHTQRPCQLSSRFHRKIIHMMQQRTASWDVQRACSQLTIWFPTAVERAHSWSGYAISYMFHCIKIYYVLFHSCV